MKLERTRQALRIEPVRAEQDSLDRLLQQRGYRVLHCGEWQEASTVCLHQNFSLIFINAACSFEKTSQLCSDIRNASRGYPPQIFLVNIPDKPDYSILPEGVDDIFPAAWDENLINIHLSLAEQRREQMVTRIQQERTRIGQDLHDGLGQHLTAASFRSRILCKQLEEKTNPQKKEAEQLHRMIQECITCIRHMAQGLSSALLIQEDLKTALGKICTLTDSCPQICCDFEWTGNMITLPSEICTGLYRIAQEAIQNALKHSRAGRIQVSVQNTQAELWLSIADNGCGIQFDCLNNSGMGISNMHHRASRIGANLCIEKQDRGGTLVKCYLPLSVIPEKGELCHAAVE